MRTLTHAVTTAAVLFMFLVCSAATAHGQPDETGPGDTAPEASEAEQLAEEAQRLFSDKQYAEAITAYLKAYNLAPAGILLYNIAFIYDKKLNELDLASDYYRRYAKAEDADPKVVERALARLQAIKDQKATSGKIIEDPNGGNGGGGGSTDVGKRKQPDRGTNVGAWATLIGGGVLVAGGVTFGLLAQSTQDDFRAAETRADADDLASTGETQALVSDILTITGGAAMVAGVVWLIVDAGGDEPDTSAATDRSSLRFGALPTRDGALLTLSGSL